VAQPPWPNLRELARVMSEPPLPVLDAQLARRPRLGRQRRGHPRTGLGASVASCHGRALLAAEAAASERGTAGHSLPSSFLIGSPVVDSVHSRALHVCFGGDPCRSQPHRRAAARSGVQGGGAAALHT
jgi:hypothetical protein